MVESVRISFNDASRDGSLQDVVVYNPGVLSSPLFSQVLRFGLKNPRNRETVLSGRLKGTRENFLTMVQSYGVTVEIVPAPQA
jgi:hypothetical protein